jgi:hypothetical protein
MRPASILEIGNRYKCKASGKKKKWRSHYNIQTLVWARSNNGNVARPRGEKNWRAKNYASAVIGLHLHKGVCELAMQEP